MAHIAFVDSSATGLLAFETARRLGHRASFLLADDLSMLDVMGVPERRVAEATRSAARVTRVPRLTEDMPEAVARLHAEDPVDAVITTSDLAVMPTAHAAARIGARYPSPEALGAAIYKDVCRATMARAGLRSTGFASVQTLGQARDAAARLGYPVVAKPARGVGKAASAILADDDALEAHFGALPTRRALMQPGFERFVSSRTVLEQYIPGGLYSAELAVSEGVARPLVVARRERAAHNPLFEVAAIMPSGLPDATEDEVVGYLQAVLTCVGLDTGVFHIEFILSPDGPVLVEINARMMGGISPQLYRHLTGLDVFETLIGLHLGEPNRADKRAVTRSGMVMAIGAVEGGRIPADVAERTTELFARHPLIENFLRLEPGAAVEAFSGNFSTLGHVALLAPDRESAPAVGLAFIADLERALGLRLARYASDPAP